MSLIAPTPDVTPVKPSHIELPSVKDVRANFDERARAKSTLKGVTLFTISMIP